jgi:hypothetical protein
VFLQPEKKPKAKKIQAFLFLQANDWLIFRNSFGINRFTLSFKFVRNYMLKNIILLLALITAQNCRCQPVFDEDGIRRNAVALGSFDTSDARIAPIFQLQKLILVGEIHGTAEPAEFVNLLATNLLGKGRTVYVGLEISPQDLVSEDELHDSAALSNSDFFKKEPYGKASKAWFRLISVFSKMNGIHLFFFGLTEAQLKEGLHHSDSLMFVNIKSRMLADTGGVYICLSGSFHSKLTGEHFPAPMGNYFLQDRTLNLSLFNMVSFNHVYAEGGGNFSTGDGIRLHTLVNSDYLHTITGMRNYFSYTHELIDGDYNGVLFTYHVTPSYGLH